MSIGVGGRVPTVIAIGGLDPSGGAGLVRDFASAADLDACAVLVGTAWTDQSASRGVRGFESRSVEAIRAALQSAIEGAAGGATSVKVGMTATPAIIQVIVAGLEGFPGPVVFDPVLGASSGGSLFQGPPEQMLPLVRRATICTPNADEAAALTGRAVATAQDAEAAGKALRQMGARAVLVKGGHLTGDAIDLLIDEAGAHAFSATRIPEPKPRGTGCALATAIAVYLAGGIALAEAVAKAKAWLTRRIEGACVVGTERHLR